MVFGEIPMLWKIFSVKLWPDRIFGGRFLREYIGAVSGVASERRRPVSKIIKKSKISNYLKNLFDSIYFLFAISNIMKIADSLVKFPCSGKFFRWSYGQNEIFLVRPRAISGTSGVSRLAGGLPVMSKISKFLEKNRKFWKCRKWSEMMQNA